MKRHCLAALIVCLALGTHGFAQVGINGTLSGIVSDASGALIPGVEVTAKHVDTGVTSTGLTNESGTYRFASLQPGNYQVTAMLSGFQSQTFRLTLGTAQQIRQNFTLQVGTVAQAVEVTVAADELLTASTASVGTVLPANQMTQLPLVTRNVMDLVTTTMPGVTGTGNSDSTFAGVTANASANVGISMDGVTMNTGRHTQGLKPTFFVNPDMIDEMRVVVAPVDVEGRGAAQIQMRARSGTNQFHGAATWNIRNSALNANTWSNNRLSTPALWYNRHQTTESLGGPIIKNKTFFFALYDRNDQVQKEITSSAVLTPLARQGIFRYFPGVNNGNFDAQSSGLGSNTGVTAVVDKNGNPLSSPAGATGALASFNVFGSPGAPLDPNRTKLDPTGFITKLLGVMPMPNAYNGASLLSTSGSCGSCPAATTATGTSVDGLNTAVHRWVRRTVGADAGGTGQIIDAYNRRQINLKIDHHFNQNHRLSGTWVRENHYTDNQDLSPWPTGVNGQTTEEPRVRTLNFTSTLTPNILNEFRYGYRSTSLYWDSAFETPGSKEKASQFMPVINGYPVYIRPSLFPNHVIGASSDFGNKSPLTTYSDTLNWTHGAHAFKGGVEWRYAYTAGYQPTPATSQTLGLIPTVTGGAGGVPVQGVNTSIPGLLTTNVTLAQNLLYFLSGSVGSTSQRFETWEPTDTKFIDYKESYHHTGQPEKTRGKIRENHQNEFNFFFKDDWKVTPNFTLNLGVRWDLFKVPDFRSGTGHFWTRGPVDGNAGYFGISGRTFNEAFHNGGVTKAGPTEVVLIGQDSKYPDLGIWPADHNNFAPAIGFSWAPRWGGKDKTTIRGGYQIAYLLPGNSLSWIDADSGRLPGLEWSATDSGGNTYRDLTNIGFPLSYPSSIDEKVVVASNNRSAAQAFYAPDYVSPYVQTFTLGVTRALPSNLLLDVRYVGTRGVKLHSTLDYNEPDFQFNGLMQALAITRAGGDAPMFDKMFAGLNLGNGVVGTNLSGSEAMRRSTLFQTNLANGDFRAVANTLNTTNVGVTIPAGVTIQGATLASSKLFPDNFIVANPQFAGMQMRNNSDSSTYHSLETQLTMRQRHGVSFQGSWTWSRATGVQGNTPAGGGITAVYRDYLNRHADYTVAAFHRTHNLRGYTTIELPFGPGKWMGGNAPSYIARVIEGWQFGTIFNVSTGAPLNITARNTINRTTNTGTPDIIGDLQRDGHVTWGSVFGNYFSQQYVRVADPACAGVSGPIAGGSNLRSFCANTALQDASGKIVLQNAVPGTLGTLGLFPIYGPGSWSLDANLQKRIRIAESKNLTIRLDASNILNHPTPGNPNLDINAGTFGEINTKTGSRTLAGQFRFEF